MTSDSRAPGRTAAPATFEPTPPDRYWFIPAERPGTYEVWVYGPGQRVGTVKLAAGIVEWITMKEFCGIFERPARRAAEQAAAAGELPATTQQSTQAPIPKASRRDADLHPAYEMREAIEYGTGLYPVNRTTGDVCDCKMKWNDDGTKLSCPICGLDGT